MLGFLLNRLDRSHSTNSMELGISQNKVFEKVHTCQGIVSFSRLDQSRQSYRLSRISNSLEKVAPGEIECLRRPFLFLFTF